MTEQEFLAAVNDAVKRWADDRSGERLIVQPFDQAHEAQCHTNAEAFRSQFGGEVVHGFLIQHPDSWPTVWVIAHSVVRGNAGLMDVTLNPLKLQGLGFFSIAGDTGDFVEWAKRYPRVTRPVPHLRQNS